MTVYVLILIAYIQGAVHHEVFRVESKEVCMEMADMARQRMPGVTAGCAAVRAETS